MIVYTSNTTTPAPSWPVALLMEYLFHCWAGYLIRYRI